MSRSFSIAGISYISSISFKTSLYPHLLQSIHYFTSILQFIFHLSLYPFISTQHKLQIFLLLHFPNFLSIQLASLTSKPLFFKYSFMVSIHLFLSLPIEHTLLHRLLAILFLSIISIWLNHHSTPSLILSSRPFFTLHNSLSLHLGLYPSSLYLAILRSCPSVHP